MNKKSKSICKLTLILIILFCIFTLLLFLTRNGFKKKKQEDYQKEMEHYEMMKENINNEVSRFAYKLWPTCNSNYWVVQGISDGELLRSAGVEKEVFLDIDQQNYCDTYSEVYCIAENKLEFKTYIRCKNYEEKGFKDRK